MKDLAAAGLLAVTVLAGAVDVCMAQTMPNQAVQRGNIGTGLGQAPLASGNFFEPRVDATLQYAANIELAANGSPQVDLGGVEVAPGFYASHSTDSATAAIDYSLIGRFWEDSDYDDVSHNLAANGQWMAVPEWFHVRGQASYADAVIDPAQGLNYGGLGIFGPGNLTEVGTASVSPILQHRFTDLEFAAEYTYGRVWYLDEGKGQPTIGFVNDQDSTDQAARINLGTFDQASRLSAKAYYEWEKSEFETALPYRYERAGLDAGLRFARTLTLVGDVGRESDLDASTTEGGLDADFWSAGLRWDPSDKTSAEARVGERFFGTSYLFRAAHRARLLELEASYSEAPTIETRLLSVGDFEPGELPPGLPEVGSGRFNSTPFVGKESRLGITAIGSRTTLYLNGYQYERDYVRTVLGDETRTGVGVGATRQLASNLSADVNASYEDFETSVTVTGPSALDVERYYDSGIRLSLNRASGSHFTLGGEAGFLSRSGDADYEGWWLALRVRWLP